MNCTRTVLNLSKSFFRSFSTTKYLQEESRTNVKKLQRIKEKQKFFQKTDQFPVWNRYKSDRFLYGTTCLLIAIGLVYSGMVVWELSYVRHFKPGSS